MLDEVPDEVSKTTVSLTIFVAFSNAGTTKELLSATQAAHIEAIFPEFSAEEEENINFIGLKKSVS